MNVSDKEFDFVIIGSGLGGLGCAYILAKHGYSVCVLEKNNQLGGNLQVFSRDKCVFDTGVHYIGSLDEGENLNKFFKYFGLWGKLKLKRMDDDGYDVIQFYDGKKYKHAQGYPRFIASLVNDFPDEEKAIVTFCDKIREVCSQFPLYNLQHMKSHEDYLNDGGMREINCYDYIASITNNVRLQNVLAGSNPLYAGVKDKTPLYVHALILNSYITGSYRVVDGGSHIANIMAHNIRELGGEIFKRKHVVGATYNDDGSIKETVLDDGEKVRGKKFISNFHPSATIDVFGESRFLKAYTKRVKSLENTLSSFTVHVTFHKNSFPYLNYNIYYYGVDDVWSGIDYDQKIWPEGFFIATPASAKSDEWATCMSVMTYMSINETQKWSNTFNTVAQKSERGDDYEKFKKEKEERVLEKLEEVFPGIRTKIKSVHSSTPLTFRDYIGNYDGSMYGILKDNNNPLRSFINPKTRIPNLYLTGQNLIFHGILGVTIGAFVTCFEFIDRIKLVEEVKNA